MTEISYHKSSVVEGNNQGTIINNFGEIKERRNTMTVIILSGIKSDYKNVDNSSHIPIKNYGQIPEEWTPYHEEKNMVNLLQEFEEESKLQLDKYFIHDFDMEDEVYTSKLSDDIAPKIVFILDIFALQIPSKLAFTKLFDISKEKCIGGFVVPLCNSLSHEQKKNAYQMREKLGKVRIAWQKNFEKPYMFIDLDVPHKFLFFRRLADIAFMYLGLEQGGLKLDETLRDKKVPNKNDL